MRYSLIFALLTLCACLSAGHTRPDECPRRLRGVFDVGSGTTKLNLSEVAVCADEVRLIRTLDDRSSLSVSLEAAKDATGAISEGGVTQLTDAIRALRTSAFATARALAPEFTSIDFAAAGTHAFRSARNQTRLTEALSELDVPIVPLTQGEEAAMGLAGAKGAIVACAGRPLVVWDVGGGSQQFTSAADGAFRGLSIGSEGFKSKVIGAFGLSGAASCEAKDRSANPLGPSHVEAAIRMAADLAQCRGDLCELRDSCVVGVGGLHARAIHAQIRRWYPAIRECVCPGGACAPEANVYHRREVECLARELSDKTDCTDGLRGPYSGLAETNVVLVAGFMRALDVESVRIVDVNMGHGLAVDRGRLTFRTQAIP